MQCCGNKYFRLWCAYCVPCSVQLHYHNIWSVPHWCLAVTMSLVKQIHKKHALAAPKTVYMIFLTVLLWQGMLGVYCIMDVWLLADAAWLTHVSSPVTIHNKLLFLMSITCQMHETEPHITGFMIVRFCGDPQCTRSCNPVGHRHCLCTQPSKMSSSLVLSVSLLLFAEGICMMHIGLHSLHVWASRSFFLTKIIAQYQHLLPCPGITCAPYTSTNLQCDNFTCSNVSHLCTLAFGHVPSTPAIFKLIVWYDIVMVPT